MTIFDESGVLAELRGITLRDASSQAAASAGTADLYTIEWQPLASDAGWEPSPAELGAQLGPRLLELAREHALSEYHRGFLEVERLSTEWIALALRELGWQPSLDETVSPEQLAQTLSVAPRYHRALGRLLGILEEDGVLVRTTAGLRVAKALAADAPRAADALSRFPSSHARIELSRRCGEQLANVLRGATDPLHLLFPDGSTELASSLYRDTPEARVYNQLIRDSVRALGGRLPAGRRLRVLEVGGGTGGTTNFVAPALDAASTEYLFTDVGPSLVHEARQRFASFPFMSFAVVDLERVALETAVHGREFDVILASNVIHATRDLRATLGALHGLLAPGGTLLMLEVAGRERWVDITFGLTVGWWHFTDSELRGGYPLLSRAAWREVLASVGFDSAEIGAPLPESREVLLAARRPVTRLPASQRPWLLFADRGGVERARGSARGGGQRAVVVVRPDPTMLTPKTRCSRPSPPPPTTPLASFTSARSTSPRLTKPRRAHSCHHSDEPRSLLAAVRALGVCRSPMAPPRPVGRHAWRGAARGYVHGRRANADARLRSRSGAGAPGAPTDARRSGPQRQRRSASGLDHVGRRALGRRGRVCGPRRSAVRATADTRSAVRARQPSPRRRDAPSPRAFGLSRRPRAPRRRARRSRPGE